MLDVEAVIFEYLIAEGNTFSTLIGNNLFVDRTGEDFDGSSQKGCMFRVRGGSNHRYAPLHLTTLDFFCYGGSNTFNDCRTIYRSLYDRLHGQINITTASGSIIVAAEVTQGQNLIDPDTKWLFTLATYQISLKG